MTNQSDLEIAAIADKFVPLDLIFWLNGSADTQPNMRGLVVAGGDAIGEDAEVRRSDIAWLDPGENAALLKVLSSFVKGVNDRTFGLQLIGFTEKLQIATYRSAELGFFDWHVDAGTVERANRKLTLIAALTDPAAYEGGELQLLTGPEPVAVPMPLGRIVALRSSVAYRITPVTRGVCRNLVGWVS